MSRSSSALRFGSPRLLEQLDAEADARERRAQLVRGVGEQHAVRADQLLDARGRAVEALGEPRHLVAALDLDARREVAGAERLDAGLQPLEPARQAAHHRIGADADRQRDGAEQRDREADGGMAVPQSARARRASGRRAAARAQAGPPRP